MKEQLHIQESTSEWGQMLDNDEISSAEEGFVLGWYMADEQNVI